MNFLSLLAPLKSKQNQLPHETRQNSGAFGRKEHEHRSKFWVFFLGHRNLESKWGNKNA